MGYTDAIVDIEPISLKRRQFMSFEIYYSFTLIQNHFRKNIVLVVTFDDEVEIVNAGGEGETTDESNEILSISRNLRDRSNIRKPQRFQAIRIPKSYEEAIRQCKSLQSL